jgi:acyl-CoA synthetase (AMP-forming)/AMP-acid ligase II
VRARLGSVGQALPGIELTVRDPDGLPVQPGSAGEIWVRGEQVSGEYVGSVATGEDGWFKTRDAGHVDDEGFLFVHGRLDDVIVRGGENLSPGEIEDVLCAHPGVGSAAVVGIPDVEWGERIVAVVVLSPGISVTENELRDHVRAVLRGARTPEHIRFAAELPFSESGKLLRRVLRDELAAEFGASALADG